MARRGDMTGSLDKTADDIRSVDAADAAITEVGKLVEKFELFSSSSYAAEASEALRKKIGFRDHGEELISCLSVMRRLMEEAERENRQLKQEKFLISSKIGNALGAVNREVQILRLELQKQDKRLVELNSDSSVKPTKGPRGEINERRIEEERQRLERDNQMLSVGYHELSEKMKNLEYLREQVRTYKEDIDRANETINCINSERRRLKSEKQDLVGQLKEAYCIIEDKENELRDFITTYEERMRESDKRLEIVTREKRQWEDERQILSSNMPTQVTLLKRELDEKDANMKELQVELSDVKDELNKLQQTLKFSVYKWDSPMSLPKLKVQSPDSLTNSDGFAIQGSLPIVDSSIKTSTPNRLILSNPEIYTSHETDAGDGTSSYFKKRKRYGRLSRVFGRGKSKKTAITTEQHDRPGSRSSDYDGDISDIVQIWETNKMVPISRWKIPVVIAFLHVHLQMPMYTDRCLENVKNGKVLADMSDIELTKALGIISYLHRRKIRLAIEDFRHPASVKYPKIGEIDHHFVAHDWLTHIGLDQYAYTFETQMVDGRLLSTMNRKDIEKYLNITSKSHQDSIQYGVELLKNLSFDRETLAKRKEKCDEYDHDPLVWSNERIIRWCDSIKLKEYSSNLRSSGVHGALLVLNHSFVPEELANCLKIPADDKSVRKHLMGELSALMINARSRSRIKSNGSRRSFKSRSKSFNRHSWRRSGGYDAIDGNSNRGELKKSPEFTSASLKRNNISPDLSSNRRSLSVRRSVTLERPISTDFERSLVD